MKRESFLEKLERETIKRLEKSPEGTLRISRGNGRVQYYHRRQPSDRSGIYIPLENGKLIEDLAKKEYDRKLLKAIRKERRAIAAYLRLCPVHSPEEVYHELPEFRKEIVRPALETDETFQKHWEDVQYIGKGFTDQFTELLTDKGERVRSKSEMIIANMLAKENIPYRYEYPVRLKTAGIVYPDFTVLNVRLRKELYWEHFGMMDDPEYAENAIRKVMAYHLSGFFSGDKLIVTAETKSTPINVLQIKGIITYFCKAAEED